MDREPPFCMSGMSIRDGTHGMDRNEGEAPLSDRGSMRDTMIGGETGQ